MNERLGLLSEDLNASNIMLLFQALKDTRKSLVCLKTTARGMVDRKWPNAYYTH